MYYYMRHPRLQMVEYLLRARNEMPVLHKNNLRVATPLENHTSSRYPYDQKKCSTLEKTEGYTVIASRGCRTHRLRFIIVIRQNVFCFIM